MRVMLSLARGPGAARRVVVVVPSQSSSAAANNKGRPRPAHGVDEAHGAPGQLSARQRAVRTKRAGFPAGHGRGARSPPRRDWPPEKAVRPPGAYGRRAKKQAPGQDGAGGAPPCGQTGRPDVGTPAERREGRDGEGGVFPVRPPNRAKQSKAEQRAANRPAEREAASGGRRGALFSLLAARRRGTGRDRKKRCQAGGGVRAGRRPI
ncbi:hypothetical protein BDY21DRAFT_361146 [Lineolata rhizophorae]|uniref:Uncharacterized protein n=1 Tax=Lineolata rhizophorae TaxID=578093 RepID=A0A6A6PB51_9PEZI|nr:hypothetical protein BDY21DRAFT_361146 [Lineolata rhizophorae]